jgi:hypothetical protein
MYEVKRNKERIIKGRKKLKKKRNEVGNKERGRSVEVRVVVNTFLESEQRVGTQ